MAIARVWPQQAGDDRRSRSRSVRCTGHKLFKLCLTPLPRAAPARWTTDVAPAEPASVYQAYARLAVQAQQARSLLDAAPRRRRAMGGRVALGKCCALHRIDTVARASQRAAG